MPSTAFANSSTRILTEDEAESIVKNFMVSYLQIEEPDMSSVSIQLESETPETHEVTFPINHNPHYTFNINSKSASVTRYTRYSSDSSLLKKIPRLQKEEASIISETFLYKIHEDRIDDLALEQSMYRTYDNTYIFTYIHIVNEVKNPTNQITIAIDGSTGEIRNYTMNWREGIQYEKPGITLKSNEEAIESFLEGLTMTYTYEGIKDEYGQLTEVKQVFVPKSESRMRYAIDLKPYNYMNIFERRQLTIALEGEMNLTSDKVEGILYEMQLAIDGMPQDVLSKEQIMQRGQVYKNLLFDDAIQLGKVQLQTMGEKEAKYKVSIIDQGEHMGSLTIGQKGLLEGLYMDPMYERKEQKNTNPIPPERLLSKVARWFAALYPDEFKEGGHHIYWRGLNYLGEESKTLFYSYTMRQYDSAKYKGVITMDLDGYSGRIVHIGYDWIQMDLPSEDVISLEEAREKYAQSMDVDLTYNIEGNHARLVYELSCIEANQWVHSIDAVTGQLLDFDFNPIEPLITDHIILDETMELGHIIHGLLEQEVISKHPTEEQLKEIMARKNLLDMLTNCYKDLPLVQREEFSEEATLNFEEALNEITSFLNVDTDLFYAYLVSEEAPMNISQFKHKSLTEDINVEEGLMLVYAALSYE